MGMGETDGDGENRRWWWWWIRTRGRLRKGREACCCCCLHAEDSSTGYQGGEFALEVYKGWVCVTFCCDLFTVCVLGNVGRGEEGWVTGR